VTYAARTAPYRHGLSLGTSATASDLTYGKSGAFSGASVCLRPAARSTFSLPPCAFAIHEAQSQAQAALGTRPGVVPDLVEAVEDAAGARSRRARPFFRGAPRTRRGAFSSREVGYEIRAPTPAN
jgi:hypothetical protein